MNRHTREWPGIDLVRLTLREYDRTYVREARAACDQHALRRATVSWATRSARELAGVDTVDARAGRALFRDILRACELAP